MTRETTPLGTALIRPVLPGRHRSRFRARRRVVWWVALLVVGVVCSALTFVIMVLAGWRDVPARQSGEGGSLLCPSGAVVFEPSARLDASVLRVLWPEYRDRRQ